MTIENRVPDAAHEDGPEPTKEKSAREAADGRIEESALSGMVRRPAGTTGDEKSGKAAGEENEFHEKNEKGAGGFNCRATSG